MKLEVHDGFRIRCFKGSPTIGTNLTVNCPYSKLAKQHDLGSWIYEFESHYGYLLNSRYKFESCPDSIMCWVGYDG
jgi:hypothetical protein